MWMAENTHFPKLRKAGPILSFKLLTCAQCINTKNKIKCNQGVNGKWNFFFFLSESLALSRMIFIYRRAENSKTLLYFSGISCRMHFQNNRQLHALVISFLVDKGLHIP